MNYIAIRKLKHALFGFAGLAAAAFVLGQARHAAAQDAPAAAPAQPAAPPATAMPAAAEPAPAPMEPAPAPMPAAEPAAPMAPAEPAPMEPTAEAMDAAPAEEAPPPADDATKKPIDVHAWLRIGGRLQGLNDPKKLDHLTADVADVEVHFDGAITPEIGATANVVGSYNAMDGNGTVELLDAIGRFDISDPFHVWVGRMLVPSDRSNFSGAWFSSPWYYPGFYMTGFGGPIAGPREGANGRNDGVTVWGQAQGGLFKYYASAFDLNTAGTPLWSGRLNLSLINPEPGYYHSSTYYGSQDILAIAVGVQAQRNPGDTDDYKEFNADVLFEKDMSGSGTITLEGALYKYWGEPMMDMSWMGVISYLTPEKVGAGKIQPLVRVQGTKLGDASMADNSISVDAQLGYVIADYAARLALGYQYTKFGSGPNSKGNAIYLGAQFLK